MYYKLNEKHASLIFVVASSYATTNSVALGVILLRIIGHALLYRSTLFFIPDADGYQI